MNKNQKNKNFSAHTIIGNKKSGHASGWCVTTKQHALDKDKAIARGVLIEFLSLFLLSLMTRFIFFFYSHWICLSFVLFYFIPFVLCLMCIAAATVVLLLSSIVACLRALFRSAAHLVHLHEIMIAFGNRCGDDFKSVTYFTYILVKRPENVSVICMCGFALNPILLRM